MQRDRQGGKNVKSLLPSPQERVLLDGLLSGVCFLNTERLITYWNDAAEFFLGYRAEDVVGKPCCDWISGTDLNLVSFCSCQGSLESCIPASPISGTVPIVTNLRHRDGYWIPLELSSFPLLGRKGKVVGAALVFGSVRESRDLENRLSEMSQIAYCDALTNIPNRRYLEEKLQEALRFWEEERRSFVGVMCDIDFFKNVNDSYGHDVGDEVLKEVARVLSHKLRASDVVGRWGGEEFLILLKNISAEDLVRRLDRLREAIGATVIQSGMVEVRVTMSFGATEPRKGETPASLLSRMDDCLYRSKREGRNRVTFEPA